MPEETVLDIAGIRKAAIIMVSLGRDLAAEVMGHLSTERIEEITREIASIDTIAPSEQDKILSEFYNLALAKRARQDN